MTLPKFDGRPDLEVVSALEDRDMRPSVVSKRKVWGRNHSMQLLLEECSGSCEKLRGTELACGR